MMDAFRGGGARILVVDDDPAVRTALAFALELEGFDVEVFPSGEALLQAVLPEDRACLIIDQRLPGALGLDTLRQLRRRGVRLPAILMTSHPNAHFRAEAAAVGAPILEKPLIGDSLIAAIALALAET